MIGGPNAKSVGSEEAEEAVPSAANGVGACEKKEGSLSTAFHHIFLPWAEYDLTDGETGNTRLVYGFK